MNTSIDPKPGSRQRRRNSVLAGIEKFRAIDPNVTVTNIVTFLYVCENEGLSVTELGRLAGLSTATASRAIRALASPEAPWSLAPHLGLVKILAHGPQRNSKTLILTDAGAELLSDLDAIIADAVPIDPADRGRPTGSPTPPDIRL